MRILDEGQFGRSQRTVKELINNINFNYDLNLRKGEVQGSVARRCIFRP